MTSVKPVADGAAGADVESRVLRALRAQGAAAAPGAADLLARARRWGGDL